MPKTKIPAVKTEKHLRALRGALASLWIQLPDNDSREKAQVGTLINQVSVIIDELPELSYEIVRALNNRI